MGAVNISSGYLFVKNPLTLLRSHSTTSIASPLIEQPTNTFCQVRHGRRTGSYIAYATHGFSISLQPMAPSAASAGPKRKQPPTDVPQTPGLRFKPASEVQATPVVVERMETLLACIDCTPMPHEVFARPACIVPNKRRKLDMGTPKPVLDVVEKHPAEENCCNNQVVGNSRAHVNQEANEDEETDVSAPTEHECTTADVNEMDDDLIDSQWFYSQSQPHMPAEPTTPPPLSQPTRQAGAPQVPCAFVELYAYPLPPWGCSFLEVANDEVGLQHRELR